MPKFRITAPDGKTYDITAPEGTTQEQALEYFKNKPQEKPLEQVPLLESFISPATAATGVGLLAKLTERYGSKMAQEIASMIAPQTGKQMLGQAATAGTAGVAGELAARQAPEKYKPVVRGGTELATSLALGLPSSLGRGPTPAIPRERIESAKYLRDIGGKPSPEQISLGPQSRATYGRLEAQQGVANRQYNRAVGLPEKDAFGKAEFEEAKRKASADYNKLLSGKKVTFDDSFFNGIQNLLNQQTALTGTGITFGQSRALIGALEKIGNVPKNLKTEINKLPKIGEEEATAEQSQKALQILSSLVPAMRQQGKIQMDATAYNEIRSILGDAAARTSNDRTAKSLRQVQGLFDDAADKSMPEIVRDLEGVRKRYEALKTLEEAQLSSGTEMGVIPAQAVGSAIKKRVDQGAIYGTNNPLRQIGESGQSLSMIAPAEGRRFAQDLDRGLTPRSTAYGVVRDIANIPLYPIKKGLASRRLEETPPLESAISPVAGAVLGGKEPKEKTNAP
jgi:hypothetical protein